MTDRNSDDRPGLAVRDEAMALSTVGGDAQLAAELYALLRASLPADLATLRARQATADWSTVAETAHRVRGASRYCGVPALDQALGNLETLARAGRDPAGIAAAVERVADEVGRLPTVADS
ncbi:Hpt domain-containing protein [Thioflavicoccus mobilis]|uniref:Hpt domain-containing protein n=1 Tax=Thioflavicoccus mobilis TaxID=80679 RepID=UPI00068778BF|nr:Hpt domain-containing protein [Thioflavicoccus mobilis]